jgi:hypothetical protein
VLALVEREGRVRSQHVANVNCKTLGPNDRHVIHAVSLAWRGRIRTRPRPSLSQVVSGQPRKEKQCRKFFLSSPTIEPANMHQCSKESKDLAAQRHNCKKRMSIRSGNREYNSCLSDRLPALKPLDHDGSLLAIRFGKLGKRRNDLVHRAAIHLGQGTFKGISLGIGGR